MTTEQMVPGTKWTTEETLEVGRALLNAIATTVTLGHESPASTLDYATSEYGVLALDLVWDFVDWTSGRGLRPGAEDRIRDEIATSGWASRVQSQELT